MEEDTDSVKTGRGSTPCWGQAEDAGQRDVYWPDSQHLSQLGAQPLCVPAPLGQIQNNATKEALRPITST
ncbi:hypothetical protein RRG08_052453 [Elysia crispata]|uniref:Uncharacterized protein n=1 Tax=Elysia crispata TaxID=231223 RepID=A0AAE1B1Z1_9GAST|nr:hypothetical protein RRG08_052453 [Elysia crispata]